MTASLDDTLAYLANNYVTLEQLAAQAGLDPQRIEALINAACLPARSHEAILTLRVHACISGMHETQDKRVRYYHRDLIALAREVEMLARERGLEEAARIVRERHDVGVAEAACLDIGSPEHVALAARAWAAWRDGTFGVCLKRVVVGDMIRKIAATDRLKAFLRQEQADGAQAIDQYALAQALQDYAAVTGAFGPHERSGSTRALVYEPALSLLQLPA